MNSQREKLNFTKLQIYKRFRDGSESRPIAAFLTQYGARKALTRLMSEEPENEEFEWVIVSVPHR